MKMKMPMIILLVCTASYFIFLFKPQMPKSMDEVKLEEADKVFQGALSDGIFYKIIPQDSSSSYYLKYAYVKRDCTAMYSLEFAKGFANMIETIDSLKKVVNDDVFKRR